MARLAIGHRIAMTLRVLAISIAGWILASGFAALAGTGLSLVGLPRSETMLVMALLSFLFFIAIVMWAFAHPRSVIRPLLVVGMAVGVTMAAKMAALGTLGT